RAGLANGSASRSSAPAATALAAGTGAGVLYTLNSSPAAYAPTVSNAAYLPNESYGDRSTAYPSSEVRRKSW
ncbi:MAG: hypothetical protein H7Z21_15300, partial [Hymenobacter sp.]|nr:hypothetical protein [Hymenobacter sp.]